MSNQLMLLAQPGAMTLFLMLVSMWGKLLFTDFFTLASTDTLSATLVQGVTHW
jgi:hypothetical protein